MPRTKKSRGLSAAVDNVPAQVHLKKRLDKKERGVKAQPSATDVNEGSVMEDPKSGKDADAAKSKRLTERDMTILSAIANVREENVKLYNEKDGNWVEMIDSIRQKIETPFGKNIAKYLLDTNADHSAVTDPVEIDALTIAETMKKNIRPGFTQQLQAEASSEPSWKR